MKIYRTEGSKLDSAFAALRYWQRHISRSIWFDRDREIAVAICLDTKFIARAFALVGFGTLNECIVHPRDVFRAAIALNSFAVILVHNHPSGDPAPSARDRELTAQLRAASDLLMIRLLDHVIVGSRNCYASMIPRP